MGRRPLQTILGALAVAAFLAAVAEPAGAWTKGARIAIADYGAMAAPRDLERQIDRHRLDYHRGVLTAPQQDDSGLPAAVGKAATEAEAAIRGHRPFAEVAYRLGVVSGLLATANHPLNTGRAAGGRPNWAGDYETYLDSARPRFAVVVYRYNGSLIDPRGPEVLATEALGRGREHRSVVGREYQRIGYGRGVDHFDDRSTAFGVGSVAFSRAVSDTVAALRYIWLRAGGADPRSSSSFRGGWEPLTDGLSRRR